MSDTQKLKDCIAEERKASKKWDETLNQIELDNRQRRQESAEKLSRQG